MKIHISSTEQGWTVERDIETEDNEKLLKALIRCVKRHTGKKEEPAEANTEPVNEDNEPDPEKERPFHEDTEEPKKKTKYKGFLLIRCSGCGKVFAVCLKTPIGTFRCRECGAETPLENLAPADMRCSSCDHKWEYMTNIEDGCAECSCLECGAPMCGWWNPKKHKYETVR